METTSDKSTMFLLLGVSNTGSGSLTFPEDFTIVGAYEDKDDAQSDADTMNLNNGFEQDEETGEVVPGEVGDNDAEFFKVHEVKVFRKGTSKFDDT